MLFPDSAKRVIANAFYDKKFEVFTFETQLGIEGDASKVFQKVGEFSGNVRFSNLAKLADEIGLSDEINIAITCDNDVVISAGNFVKYNEKMYLATEVLPFDSHKLIAGRLG